MVTWCNPQALIDGTMLFGSFHANNPGAVSTQLILGSSLRLLPVVLRHHRPDLPCSPPSSRQDPAGHHIICGIIIIFYGGKLIWNFFQMIL